MRKRFKTAYIELTNQCNRNCDFCHGTTRAPGFMEEELFAKIAGEAAPLTELAYLHIMGEALLHPHLDRILESAASAALPLAMTTNGTLFGTKNAELLLSHFIRQLNISLHSGVTEAELDEILRFAEKALKYHPEMYINYRLWDVCPQNGEYLRYLSSRFGKPLNPTGETARHAEQLRDHEYIHIDRSFIWPDFSNSVESSTGYCHGGVDQYGIFCTGEVTACCLDADGALVFGNVKERSLREILSSTRMERMRNSFHRGEVNESLCLHCSYRNRFAERAENLKKAYLLKKRQKKA